MDRSRRLMERAQAVIPGGVNSPVRAFRAVGGHPPFIARAERNHLFDVDGFAYVDLVSSWGAIIAGHANRKVVEAAAEAAIRGSTYGAPTEGEVRLAEAIVARVPSVEQVRLVSSGTEATLHAIRLARAATGRDLVVKIDGCYHGAHDSLLVGAGSGVATFGIPGSPGVPAALAGLTLVVAFNDAQAMTDVFAAHGERIAAVILEPIAGNMGCIPPVPGYLEAVRALTQKYGALLIFDEVMTGFRVAPGGAQALYDVTPDLTCLGKVVGGGFPLAAFGGRADLMQQLAPVGPVYQGGTLSGNPVAVAAGLATLEQLDGMAYLALEAAGQAIEEAIQPACAYHGLSFSRVGSMFTLFFRPEAPKDFVEAKESDTALFASYFQAALSGGVYLPCSQFEAAFFSLTLQGDDLEDAVDGLCAALVAID
jgi:glutamate-1-semialdehyde 2,1-aminomutase